MLRQKKQRSYEADMIAILERELHRDPLLQNRNTRRAYRADLVEFERWRKGRSLNESLVEQYAIEISTRGKSPATVQRRLSAVRWCSRRLAEMGMPAPTLSEGEQVLSVDVPPIPVRLIEQVIARDPRLQSPNTRRAYRADLAAFEAWRAGRPITPTLQEQYAAALQQSCMAPSTIARRRAAVRWWVMQLRKLTRESSGRFVSELERSADQVRCVVRVEEQEQPVGVDYQLDRLRRLAIAVFEQAVSDALTGKMFQQRELARAWLLEYGLEWVDLCDIDLPMQEFRSWLDSGCPSRPRRQPQGGEREQCA